MALFSLRANVNISRQDMNKLGKDKAIIELRKARLVV